MGIAWSVWITEYVICKELSDVKETLETIKGITAQAQGALGNLTSPDASVRQSAVSMVRDAIGRINAKAAEGLTKK